SRARAVPRCRRSVTRRVPPHHAARNRARIPACLPAPAATPLAAALREILDPLPRVLPPQSGQQTLRPAPAVVVRAESSRRGFCRNVRRLVAAPVRLAAPLPGMAGAQEAGVRGRVDGRDWWTEAADFHPARDRSAASPAQDARRALRP